MSSTFECPVVKVYKRPHPNADTLSIVDVFGWQVVVKTDDWQDGELGVYVRPDSIVPDTKEWDWLEGHRRIKTRRFRGEWSHGLLTKIPEGRYKEGDNLADVLQIVNYEPPMRGESSKPLTWQERWSRKSGLSKLITIIKGVQPRGHFPNYDVEHLRRFMRLIPEGEEVIITEKIHGANALYVYKRPIWFGKKKIYMRSRKVWKPRFIGGGGFYKNTGGNIWKRALEADPLLIAFLKANPDLTVYGEVYGKHVQELEYGSDIPRFAAFDIWDGANWLPKEETFRRLHEAGVQCVPILYEGPYSFSEAIRLSQQTSTLCPGQLQEGIVVTTKGKNRKQLKLVNDKYLEKAK